MVKYFGFTKFKLVFFALPNEENLDRAEPNTKGPAKDIYSKKNPNMSANCNGNISSGLDIQLLLKCKFDTTNKLH